MNSLVYGEHYASSITSTSSSKTLPRTYSLTKYNGSSEISSASPSSPSSSTFSSSSASSYTNINNNNNPNPASTSEFVTVVEVDESLRKAQQQGQQKLPFGLVNGLLDHQHQQKQQYNNNSSAMMSKSIISSSVNQQTVNNVNGSTIEPFVTVLEVGNPLQNNSRDPNTTNNVVISSTGNQVVVNKGDCVDNVNRKNNLPLIDNGNNQRSPLHRYNVNNTNKMKTLMEQVTVYRLPGERLGMTLKFDGGANLDETIENLYIQNINPDSPASRISGSTLGRLCEGDEILEISGDPVNTMTRKECVAALGDAPICFKMLVKRQETIQITETITSAPQQPVVTAHTVLTTALSTPILQQPQPQQQQKQGEVDYHKATLRRVDSENVLTPPIRTRRQPPPVPPRNSTTSLTSGNSFRSPIKPPARKRPSQPPPLPPRRSKDTSGKPVLTIQLSDGQMSPQVSCNGDSSAHDSHRKITHTSSFPSSMPTDRYDKHASESSDVDNKMTKISPTTDNLPSFSSTVNHQSDDIKDSHGSTPLSTSSLMGTPYLNGTSEMIVQGIKNVDKMLTKDCRLNLPDKPKGSYDSYSHQQNDQSLPTPPDLYIDTVSSKANLAIESDSDDTGSSVSTVIERFSFAGYSYSPSDSSNGTAATNNNSYRLPVTRSNSITSNCSSNSSSLPSTTTNFTNCSSSYSSSNPDIGKTLDPFEKLRREFDEKGSLEELIAVAKSGFSLDNLINEKNEPRSSSSNQSSDFSSKPTTTATINDDNPLMSAHPSSSPCSMLGPPTHQAPSPPLLPSLPSLSPSRYEVNLDDYDDIQSISLTYESHNNSTAAAFCEPIVEPPKSFSNSFPSIREEGESSLEYEEVNGDSQGSVKKRNKIDEDTAYVTSAADAAIAAADSVTLDAQEILSIVENMKLDEDLSLIPSISDPLPLVKEKKSSKLSYNHSNEETIPGNVSVKSSTAPVNGHSPLSASSSSASLSSSSTLPMASEVSSFETDDEDKPTLLQSDSRVRPLSPPPSSYESKVIHSYELNTGNSELKSPSDVHYNEDSSRMMNSNRHGPGSRHSSICSSSSNDSSTSSSSMSLSPSSSLSPPCSASSGSPSSLYSTDPRSSPSRLTNKMSKTTNRPILGIITCANSLIPKMVELPNRGLTSRLTSPGILARKSKSTLNLSSFTDFDSKPSLIPRPILTNAKSTTNLTSGYNTSISRSNYNGNGFTRNGIGINGNGNSKGYSGNHFNHHNHCHNQQSINGSSKNGSIFRRSKSIENMRSLTYNVNSISLSTSYSSSSTTSSNGHHQTNGRRSTGSEPFGRSSTIKGKDCSPLFTAINKNDSAKTIESSSSQSSFTNTNNSHYNHHNTPTNNSYNCNHLNSHNNNNHHHHQSNGQSKVLNHSCNNGSNAANHNNQRSLARCTEKNLFNAEFNRSRSSLTSSSINTLPNSSSLSPSLSSASPSSSSSSSASSASSTASSSSSPTPPTSTSPSLSLSSNGNHQQYHHTSYQPYHQPNQQQQTNYSVNHGSHDRMIDLKIDLSDDEKDDIKELEELEEFIAREMKCKSESDDFLADELFIDSSMLPPCNSDIINGNGHHETEPESAYCNTNNKIVAFPTIPEEQEDHPSLEMIDEEERQVDQKSKTINNSMNHNQKETSNIAKHVNNGTNDHLGNGHREDAVDRKDDKVNCDGTDQDRNGTNSRVKYIVFTKIIDL